MKIYVKKISLISILSLLFWFSIMILSYTLILPILQLQTQQVMPQIRSHIEYLIQTYNILVLILYSKLLKNLASVRFNDDSWYWLTFWGHPIEKELNTAFNSLVNVVLNQYNHFITWITWFADLQGVSKVYQRGRRSHIAICLSGTSTTKNMAQSNPASVPG